MAYRFGPFQLDVAERRLLRDETPIVLTPRAFDVLAVMVEHAGSLVTKDELMRRVWAGCSVEEANLGVTISALRRAIGRDLIETVPKHGYRFTAAVVVNDTPRHALPSSASTGQPPQPQRLGRRWGGVLGAALLILVAGSAMLPWWARRPSNDPWPQIDAATVQRLTISFARESQVSVTAEGRLLFMSDRSGSADIFIADASGENATSLTMDAARDEFPVASHDGRTIAFASDRAGDGLQIFTMNHDGSGVRQLTKLFASATAPAWSPDGSRIAFQGQRDPQIGSDIYTVRPDGSALTRLTSDHIEDRGPTWSHDGRAIAFARNPGGASDFDLYLIESHGGVPRRVTSAPGRDLDPAWSPDGSQLAFVSDREGTILPELHVLDLPGGATRKLAAGAAEHPAWTADGRSVVFATHDPGNWELARLDLERSINLTQHAAEDSFGAWDPGGTSVVFTSNRDGKKALFRLAAPGGPLTKLTDGVANDWFPSWSPDGSQVVFQSDREGMGSLNLCIATIASGRTRCITRGREVKGSPAWSPDGSRIAFQSNIDSAPLNVRIFTIAPDGTGWTRLTSGEWYDGDPSWSPDSAKLAFCSTRAGGTFQVFTMNRDGSGLAQLTFGPGVANHPWWSPDGKWIVFTRTDPGWHDLYAVPSAGGAPMRLTYKRAGWPRWHLGGKYILFTAPRQGNDDIWVVAVPKDLLPVKIVKDR